MSKVSVIILLLSQIESERTLGVDGGFSSSVLWRNDDVKGSCQKEANLRRASGSSSNQSLDQVSL